LNCPFAKWLGVLILLSVIAMPWPWPQLTNGRIGGAVCRALNLVGPTGAGKSHLAAIWQSLIGNSHHFGALEAEQMPPEPAFYVLDNIDV
jgi:hypothetical protein